MSTTWKDLYEKYELPIKICSGIVVVIGVVGVIIGIVIGIMSFIQDKHENEKEDPKQECPTLTSWRNVKLDTFNTTIGTKVKASCVAGFAFDHGPINKTLVCENTGDWNVTQLLCIRRCLSLTSKSYLKVNTRDNKIGTKVEVSCEAGFEYADGWSKRTLLCTESGKWDGDPPHCVINGGYSQWSQWSDCPLRCGSSNQTRQRFCVKPKPDFGGLTCVQQHLGQATESKECTEICAGPQIIAVNGNYSKWSPWGNCPVTCGFGIRTRQRSCDNPKPNAGGLTCEQQYLGQATEAGDCNQQTCAGAVACQTNLYLVLILIQVLIQTLGQKTLGMGILTTQ